MLRVWLHYRWSMPRVWLHYACTSVSPPLHLRIISEFLPIHLRRIKGTLKEHQRRSKGSSLPHYRHTIHTPIYAFCNLYLTYSFFIWRTIFIGCFFMGTPLLVAPILRYGNIALFEKTFRQVHWIYFLLHHHVSLNLSCMDAGVPIPGTAVWSLCCVLYYWYRDDLWGGMYQQSIYHDCGWICSIVL